MWAWNVPRSKGTGTPYTVSVRWLGDEVFWGCNCMAGKNGHPSCQHRMRVQFEIVTVKDMLKNLPLHVREIVAPSFSALPTRVQAISKPTTSDEMSDEVRSVRIV